MAGTIEARMAERGIVLPTASGPGANYVVFRKRDGLMFISGQLCKWNGENKFIGKLGREFDVAQGREAARLCALNVVAQLKAALEGDLDRMEMCMRVGVFVNADPEFGQHAQVANGASDVLIEIFGEAGRHTRTSIGVGSLPYGVATEMDAIFAVR